MTDSVLKVGRGQQQELLDSLRLAARQPFTIVDENVARLYPAWGARADEHGARMPAGEQHKTWDTLHTLLLALDAAGVDRGDHVLAVGGGVTTDVAGLAAALHRRGVAWSAVPTTLVGQVDAALGGKTAVNLAGGKNTVGTFHQPEQVIVDPSFLGTLAARHRRAGMAEVIKTTLLADSETWAQVLALRTADLLESVDGAELEQVIATCLSTKQRLVSEDPTDRGARRLLNLGHTFGHAFEAVALPDLHHGEAVGLGLLCAARLAALLDPSAAARARALEEQLHRLLGTWGLPTAPPDGPARDKGRLVAETSRDKKRQMGRLAAVAIAAPGDATIHEDVSTEVIATAFEAALNSTIQG